MSSRERSWWGWGWRDDHLGPSELESVAARIGAVFGSTPTPTTERSIHAVSVPAPAVEVPDTLASLVSLDDHDRVVHGKGQAFVDVVEAFEGRVGRVPDAVARPAVEKDVTRVLEWADEAGIVVVPWGGGTSVVGGVRPPDAEQDPRPVLSLDLGKLSRVTDVDSASQAVRIQGGAAGPQIEEQLRPHGLSLRFYPQSWEFSTLGGWVVTRAGGHFATGATHIDDMVESIEAVTPSGPWTSRRLPASGAGPSPDRLWLGSEGTLGIVTAAWVRAVPRPTQRASVTVLFPTFEAGAQALREIVQSGLRPSNARLLDPVEAMINQAGDGRHAVLALGMEGTGRWLGSLMDPATTICRNHGGLLDGMPKMVAGDRSGAAEGGAAAWRDSFLKGPYLRDGLIQLGATVETFETAITWDRFETFVGEVRSRVQRAAEEAGGGQAIVSARLTHLYPDGAAPYFTVILPGREGARREQWLEVKAAASEAIIDAGGTITHHHAVGRDHLEGWHRQRPEGMGTVWGAVRTSLDPNRIMNPGVLG